MSELPFDLGDIAGKDKDWSRASIQARDGRPVVNIERLTVRGSSQTNPELESVFDEVSDLEPRSALDWLEQYLRSVHSVYRFEVLPDIDACAGWPALHVVQGAIWEWAGGILQSDGEGVTNENGYYILWRFVENAAGLANMAVLDGEQFVEFEMDLADPEQRAAFREGRVPDGADPGALSSP